MTGPLTGIRVVDMTSILMGPFATQILADYGADVVKVEGRDGDLMRHGGAMRHPKMGALYLQANRNKRSIVVDVKKPSGRDIALRLCSGADVFIHSVRTAGLARLGLSYDGVRAVKKNIIYVSLVGYGETGPYAGRPAYDDLIQGISAVPSLFARDGKSQPRFMPMNVADRVVGLNAVHAVLAALFHRERTGEGQSIEVPMFETMSQFVLGDHLGGLTFDPPSGPWGYDRLLSADRRPYQTRDGYLCVLVYTDRQWQNFLTAAGRADEFKDPLYSDHAIRTRNYDRVYANLARFLLEHTTEDWIRILTEHDIPCVPAHDIESLISDPHLKKVGLINEMDHPSEGRVRMVNPPARFSRTQPTIRTLAPQLGQHTQELLAELGYSADEINGFVETKSVA